jgi:hypothetical protein
MPNVPQRANALSVISNKGRNPNIKRLKLAMIFSENTQNASEYLKKAADSSTGRWSNVNDVAFFESINTTLEKTFASVVTVDSPEQARAEGAQLVAILDVFASLGSISFTKTSVDVGATFQALDGTPIGDARGSAVFRVPYPNTSIRWKEANEAAVSAFAVALSTNAELAAFAAKAAPAPGVAPAPAAAAPAPVAKLYRSDVESPDYRLAEDPHKFALVVGVEHYSTLPAAENAVRDARAIKAHLLASGYPERNIVLLTDQLAGKSGFDKYLDAWLPKNTDERSTVLFYFSGHGAPDPSESQAYLVPWDGDPKFLAETAYPVKKLYERLNGLKARKVLLAMDACFSGTGGRSVLAKGTRPLVSKVDLGAGSAGRVQGLTASASDEISGVDEESGHGLFTYQLLKALGARAGKASLKELYDALSPKVRDAARRDNRDQTPQLIGAGDAAF